MTNKFENNIYLFLKLSLLSLSVLSTQIYIFVSFVNTVNISKLNLSGKAVIHTIYDEIEICFTLSYALLYFE